MATHSVRDIWNHIVRPELIDLGIPEAVLHKGCIAPYEIQDIVDICGSHFTGRILEIGTFVGASACLLALSFDRKVKIQSIDPGFPLVMQLGESHKLSPVSCLEIAHTLAVRLEVNNCIDFVQGFFSCYPTPELLQRICQNKLSFDKLKIIAKEQLVHGPFDIAIVDGEHSEDAVCSDLNSVQPLMAPQAKIILHDIEGYWGKFVSAGIDMFIKNNPIWRLKRIENLAQLERM